MPTRIEHSDTRKSPSMAEEIATQLAGQMLISAASNPSEPITVLVLKTENNFMNTI